MSMQITVGDDRDDDEREDVRGEVDRDDEDEVDRGSRETDRRRDRPVDDDPDTDDDEEPEDGWAAEARRLRAALKKSNATGQRRRQQLKEYQAAQQKAGDTDDDGEDEEPAAKDRALDARTLQREIEKAKKAARKEADEEHRRELLTLKAESRLSAAGVSEKAVRLLKKEIDFDDFELDPEDEIDRLRVEYPDLFKRTRGSGRRINGGDDRDSGGKRRPQTTLEKQVAILEGRGRS